MIAQNKFLLNFLSDYLVDKKTCLEKLPYVWGILSRAENASAYYKCLKTECLLGADSQSWITEL